MEGRSSLLIPPYSLMSCFSALLTPLISKMLLLSLFCPFAFSMCYVMEVMATDENHKMSQLCRARKVT